MSIRGPKMIGLFVVRFSRVRSASIRDEVGMRLDSLGEVHATPPFRRFVFVDSEEKSDRHCEVVPREIVSTEMTEDVHKEAIVHLRNPFPKQR